MKKVVSFYSKTEGSFERHMIRENNDDQLAYILDPSGRLVERDATGKDYRASCYDFSGMATTSTNDEYVRCIPSSVSQGCPKAEHLPCTIISDIIQNCSWVKKSAYLMDPDFMNGTLLVG